jgi:hypothetical protein
LLLSSGRQFLKAADGLWAAGDVARYPYHLTGEAVRVEHWGMAQTQGTYLPLCVSCVVCRVSCVVCRVSCVVCRVSCVC